MKRRGKRAIFDAVAVGRAERDIDARGPGSGLLPALAVLMAARLDLAGEDICRVLRVSLATLGRMNDQWRRGGAVSRPGGRYHQALTKQQEDAVMLELAAGAIRGKGIRVKAVQATLTNCRRRPVCLATAYNCIRRAGWHRAPARKGAGWLPPDAG